MVYLTPDQRKGLLGLGGLKLIKDQLELSEGHVSLVNSEKRFDARVREAISNHILARYPKTDPASIWPAWVSDSDRNIAAAGGESR